MKTLARTEFGRPLLLSLLLHGVAAAALLYVRASEPRPSQQYRATLVAALPGPRAMGEVRPQPAKEEPVAAPVKSGSPRVAVPETRPVPVQTPTSKSNTPTRSTAIPDPVKSTKVSAADPPDDKAAKAASPPRAGGGPVGGSGSDVTNAVFKGIDFPDQRYLTHIINRIMMNFPQQNVALVAEFSFEILRDGTMQNLRMIRSSRNANFDSDAEGAIERAGRSRGFGALPAVWNDDILRIEFRFDPRLINR